MTYQQHTANCANAGGMSEKAEDVYERRFIPCGYRTINSIFNQLVNQRIRPRNHF